MKLLRLYFWGFLLSLDVHTGVERLKEEVAIVFTDNLKGVYEELICNDYIVQSILDIALA